MKNTVNTELHRGGRSHPPMSPPSPIDNFANPCYNILFSISIFFSLFSLCFTVGCACRTRGAGVGPLRKNGASPHRPTRGEQAKPIEEKGGAGKKQKQDNKQIIFGATLKAYEL